MRNGNSYHNPMSNLPLPLFPKIGNDQEAIETAPQLQSKRTIRLSPHNSSTPRRIQRDRPLISSSPSLSSPRRNDSSSDESKSALETSSDGSRQSNNSNLLQSPHRPLEMSQEQNGQMTPSTLESLTRQTHCQRRRPNELRNDEKSENNENHYYFYYKCITETNEIQINQT